MKARREQPNALHVRGDTRGGEWTCAVRHEGRHAFMRATTPDQMAELVAAQVDQFVRRALDQHAERAIERGC